MATIYEVSKLAGVSLATVSRVINNSSSVKEKTREKVYTAMQQLSYRPNPVAKSLASNRSDCVGVVVSELQGAFYGGIMTGIESVMRKADKHIIVTASHYDAQKEIEDIEFLVDRNCDALVLHVEAVSDEYLINLSKGSVPIIVLNRRIPEIADRCISLDNERGGYLATRFMIDNGHRDIVYVSGPLRKEDARDRLAGHKRALKENHLFFEDAYFYEGDYLQTGGSKGLQHFIDNDISFTAVICANDEMATGAMTTAREHGLDIPNDLSVCGFDDVIFSAYTFPKLSTIHYPISDMGEMAAYAILKSVYKRDGPPIINVFQPNLVERNSVVQRALTN